MPRAVKAQSIREEAEKKIVKKINDDIAERDEKQRKLLPHYKKEKQIAMSISPMYAPYFGRNMLVSLNGITLRVPVDGRNFSVPESFAAEIYSRIKRTDKIVKQQEGIARNGAVFESTPGDIKVFR